MTSLLNSIKNLAKQTGEDTKTRFSVTPTPGDSGFTQWQSGMRMVARLPEGIPSQFRKTLWLNLAEKHLASRGVEWEQVEEFCFNEYTNPDDEELGVQIVKDVHRTGCSLFCGVSGKDNQALLKRVLLAYARWNKAVGYCQGFNMLAALILQVMDKSEVDSVKVMIFLIEGVLPESYFANNLRGLSVDMAVFRDLLRIKLPILSRHLDQLQCGDAKDAGTSYEPPLTNVFTMQWFLTLFCNCLPQDTVLRVWDLIFLEGNHVLLCTALAIWSTLSDRILTVESADEFYCIMGVLTREMLEFGLMDANALIKAIVSFSLIELPELREKYLYNITPWTQSVSTVARRGLRLFYSDDDTDTEEDDEKIAIATAYGLFKSPKKKEGSSGVTSPPRALTCPDKEKIAMDISALTKQYRKLRERQKQAHVILTAACGSQGLVGPTTSPAMNHLLMGKFALVNNKGRRLGPPPGSIPPPSQTRTNSGEKQKITISGETLHWKDTVDAKKTHQKDSDDERTPESPPSKYSSRRGSNSSSSSTSTELCDDPHKLSDSEDQSNSLSECNYLPTKTEPSTPLRLSQQKGHHPDDSAICKEEVEEDSEPKQSVCSNNRQLQAESPEEGRLSVSPEGDTNQRRKLSFKIDREELRELDRKLSLKIVEIERKKSNAGIESEDLNSKVLFPFDRDYIQEAEKSDRDTPSSIPDDRLCSTEITGSFEEETILVPDLITTHKPYCYRMTSLEECDESKDSENVDYDEVDKKESFDSNEDELEFYDGRESTEDNYEYDSNECNMICTKFNFDDLFHDNKIDNEETLSTSPNNIDNVTSECYHVKDVTSLQKSSFEAPHEIEPMSCFNSEVSTAIVLNDLSNNIDRGLERSNSMNIDSNGEKQSEFTSLVNTSSKSVISKDVKSIKCLEPNNAIADQSEVSISQSFSPKYSQNELIFNKGEEVYFEKDVLSRTQLELNVCPNNVEKNISSLALENYNVGASIPDVVTSRDITINLIREKYAQLSTVSLDLGPSSYKNILDSGISQLSTDTTKYPCTSDLTDSDKNQNQEDLVKNSNYDKLLSNEKNMLTDNENLSVTSSEQTSDMNELPIPKETRESRVIRIDDDIESSKMKNSSKDQHFSEFTNKSTIRRGSEVALSLILKENSQILTKIHQQSRRSSMVSVDFKQDSCLQKEEDMLHKTHEAINTNSDSAIHKVTAEQDGCVLETTQSIYTKSYILDKSLNSYGEDQSDVKMFSQDMLNKSPSLLKKTADLSLDKLQESNILDDKLQKSNILDDTSNLKKIYKNNQEPLDFKDLNKEPALCASETLPDVCKRDKSLNSICKDLDQTSKLTDHGSKLLSQMISYSENVALGITKESNPKEYCNKNFADSYFYTKKPSIMSPTKEVEEISPPEVKFNSKFEVDSLPGRSSVFTSSTEYDKESQITSRLTSTDISKSHLNPMPYSADNIDANEDILKELQYLDIKPEETLDYSSKSVSSSPKIPSSYETYSKRRYKYSENTHELSDTSDSQQYGFSKYRQTSFDYLSRTNISGTLHKRDYKENKAVSLDTASLDNIMTDSHSDEKIKSIINSEIGAEEDNSLYINSLKSHGRLLIEKGELNTYKDLGKIHSNLSDVKSGITKSQDTLDRSAYDIKTTYGSKSNTSQSEFLSTKPVLFENSEFEKRGKTLFKYKSEDYGRSTSPSHYRFSSASPVRKRLENLSSDSSFSENSTLKRTKSPSPTAYSSSQTETKEHSRVGISGSSRDYKRYSRAESLDLQSSTYVSELPRKRSESFETSSSRKVLEEKSPVSPSSPVKFNPFPIRSSLRQPKELGVKLGLYLPPKSDKSPSKRLT